MRVSVVGGGPAGLYFALLIKRMRPAFDVTVYERNAPGDTFGWGVVFSGRTMDTLAEADPPSFQQLKRLIRTWDNVDVVHLDQAISIHGNRFFGIQRIAMLATLQARCRELDVGLEFGRDVTDLASLDGSDLIVGADGVNSIVRESQTGGFGTTVSEGANYYVWYGTGRIFDGLTLTFRRNEAGIFAAHSYKFAPELSTFIVECDPETWSRAGLEHLPEPECRADLEDVFAGDLQGHRLLTNQSRWIRFKLVQNRHWYRGSTVLVGDAAHTAHFSIGSGTKLALEDSIALAECIDSEPTIGEAVERYEQRRKPAVDAYQIAAGESQQWFERLDEVIDLDPIDLAYHAMTRSTRLDRSNLERRDPAFVATYDAYVRGQEC